MKKPYQIEAQRAVRRLEEMASDGNPAVQMVLPLAEALGWLKRSAGELIRQAGVQIIGLMMEGMARLDRYSHARDEAEKSAEKSGQRIGTL